MMSSDQKEIQGLWRLVSGVFCGKSVGTLTTHYQFDGSRLKEINPWRVDDGKWASFELHTEAQLKRFTKTSELQINGGKTFQRVDCWLYDLNGDTLRLCWPNVFGDYPDSLDEKIHGVMTFTRDFGPPPKMKQPSDKKPIKDAVLGRMTWDDNFDWWKSRVRLRPGQIIDCHIELGEGQNDADALEAGREFIYWLHSQDATSRLFAAGQLLDLYNESWNEGNSISVQEFADRITLESVGIDAGGGMSLLYKDGRLFLGHCIIVSLDSHYQFKDATIAG